MSKASNKFFQFLFIFLWFVASATALEIGGHSFRDTLCLNGYWEFQGVDISDNWKRGEGVPPLFPPIEDGKWEDVKLKIPSPWNVNTWGGGRDVGTKEHNKYWPDSVYFPSYPESWDKIEMGRVRRSFELTEKRASSRYLLHFQSVAGECTIYLNGKRIGSHFDKFLPFEFDVTDSIKSGTNEVLLEIRSHLLFDKQSKRFPKMRATYPCGSETHTIVGITEDVNLVCVPEVYIDDIYIKPLLDENRLEIEITIQNATAQNISGAGLERKIDIATNIIPAKNSIDNSNERIIPGLQKKLADTAIKPGKTLVKLSIPIAEGQLKYWFPDNPELYYLEVRLIEDAREFESVRERFGWRQFKIVGPELRLNGKKIQLLGDLLHPFGPFIYDPGIRTYYNQLH